MRGKHVKDMLYLKQTKTQGAIMDWNKKLNMTLDYIEDHLQRSQDFINPAEIETIVGCSHSFFQKIFFYMNGISLTEYIRNRKMTLAGYDLKSTDVKIVDLSFKYGYDSPTAFTRAFRKFHGLTPKEARAKQAVLEVYPRMNFKQENQISWKLETKKPFRLLGVTRRIDCQNGNNFIEIPAFWNELMQSGRFGQLMALNKDCFDIGVVGLCLKYYDTDQTMDYAIAAFTEQEKNADLTEILLPPETWAVFECIGPMPSAIQKGWHYLTSEWLVKYPFRHAACPELEWYGPGNSFAEDYHSEIWIPITMEEL